MFLVKVFDQFLHILNICVRKIPYFMFLLIFWTFCSLLNLFLVISFIHWHTQYLTFTTNSLIWMVCFQAPKYVCDNKFIVDMNLLSHTLITSSHSLYPGVFLKSLTCYHTLFTMGVLSDFDGSPEHLWPLLWSIYMIQAALALKFQYKYFLMYSFFMWCSLFF